MIVRNRPTQDFTILRNQVLNDPNLSLKAKGLWAFLMSKPDGWQTTIRGLMSQCKEGQASVVTALKELEAIGLYKKTRINNTQGHIKWEDYVYDEPCVDFPHVVKPVVEKPSQVKTELVKPDKGMTDQLVPAEQGLTPVFGNTDINEIIKMFEYKNGSRLTKPKLQRFAANRLIKKMGADKVIRLVQAAIAVRDQQYAPQIFNLLDLEDKLPNLLSFYAKGNAKQASKTVVIR